MNGSCVCPSCPSTCTCTCCPVGTQHTTYPIVTDPAAYVGEPPFVAKRSSESILVEAQRLVAGSRQTAYGHPADDFTKTGRMWGAILGIPDVSPEKVGLCLAAVKISREVNAHKRDNLTDLAGYALAVDLIEQRKAGR